MITGLTGAVYESNTAPVTSNIALLLDWELDVEHSREYVFGGKLHGIPAGWHVKAGAYWAGRRVEACKVFVRLFIGKEKDMRCLAGWADLPGLQATPGIRERVIRLDGIGALQYKTEGIN